jgi:surface antigen
MTGRSLSSGLARAGIRLTGLTLAAALATPVQAHPTLQFVDVTRAQGSGYRVTSISNYRIGVITPIRTSLAVARKVMPVANYAPDAVETLPGYLQCVPYARQVSGIQLFGDARTWWSQAAGRYSRGNSPKAGAVMAFRPYGKMVLGHVAAVSKVLDSRRVLLRHANWSPISGRRGQVERDVLAMDVSPGNDWSEVRVWYDPIHGLGTTHWPVSGFIYAPKSAQPAHGLASTRWTSDPIGAIIAAFSLK